jgi:hypothetical protein
VASEVESFIRDAARKRGIDEDTVVRAFKMEGGVDEPMLVGKFKTGWSFWPPQLHYAMEGAPGVTQPTVGMGEGFTKLTGWQPGDPAAWRDAVRYALNRVKTGGWGPWYGPASIGITGFDGVDRSALWDANAERWDFEDRAGPALAYNPDLPPERQVQSWTCSIRATAWLLKSLELPVEIGALQDEMSPTYVTPDLGLLDGRGYGLAEVVKAHLPAEHHSRVHVFERISWDELKSLAGSGPIALGLHGAYHWINVAKALPDGTLSTPNPAPKYPAEAPIGDVLTREEFDRWGPASAVWVNMSSVNEPGPTDPSGPSGSEPPAGQPDLAARVAELEAEVGRLKSVLGYARVDISDAMQREIDAIKASAGAAEAAVSTLRRQE